MALHFSLEVQALEPYHKHFLLHPGMCFNVKFLEADYVMKLA
jgi:hypothetical protein